MDYFKVKRVNNSSLSYIDPDKDGSAKKYKAYIDGNLKQDDTPSLERGDLVHKFMLEPEKFVVQEMDAPGGAVLTIVDELLLRIDEVAVPVLSQYGEEILQIAKDINYGQTWKPQTVIDKVVTGASAYFEFKVRNGDKQVISHQTGNVVRECVASLERHKGASTLLNASGENLEVHKEIEIYFDLKVDGNVHECKVKLDQLIINHASKSFTIVDLKTTGKHISKYPDSFYFYDTDRQIAFYETAVFEYLKEKGIEGYKPSSHYIIAVMNREPFLSRVFKIPESVITLGKVKYEGLLNRIAFHEGTANWVDEMEYQQGQLAWEMPTINTNDN